MDALYPCPCCGYFVHDEPAGSYAICPICAWEDDLSQLRFVTSSGANKLSLIEAQKAFLAIGARDEASTAHVRKPESSDRRDLSWRMFDPVRDTVEFASGDEGRTYSYDSSAYYYWRKK